VLLSNPETGKLNCTACMLCMKAMKQFFSGIYNLILGLLVTGKHLGRHAITLQYPKEPICCFCGLCEETCSFDAIKLANKYEFSTFDQSTLIYDKDHLTELGRDVPYIPRPKKKPVIKKPAATAKPAGDKPAAEEVKKDAPAKVEEKTEQKPAEARPEKPAAGKDVKNKEDKPKETPAPDMADDKQAELELNKKEEKKDTES